MESLLQGIIIGLGLCILVGPILVTILQASMENGKWAGFLVGVGIWLSDFLFIVATYLGLSKIRQLTDSQHFELSIGIVGGIILTVFGLGIYLSKRTPVSLKEYEQQTTKFSIAKYIMTGFLVNTVNPFTIIFWMGLSSTTFVNSSANSHQQAILFYGGILGTIIITDLIKINLSVWITRALSPQNIIRLQKIAGLLLIIFGIALIVRVLI